MRRSSYSVRTTSRDSNDEKELVSIVALRIRLLAMLSSSKRTRRSLDKQKMRASLPTNSP